VYVPLEKKAGGGRRRSFDRFHRKEAGGKALEDDWLVLAG